MTQGDAPAKEDISSSFSRAAESYDSVAKLQREVGKRLLTHLDLGPAAADRVLDLGCGTGFFQPDLSARYPGATYLGLDLAPGMITYARARSSSPGLWIVGDAECLPLATESVDVVFSSLAVQWCHRPEWFLSELARILKPGGRCVFTTLGPDTLRELREAWAAVDAYQHVNNFLPAEALLAAAGTVPGVELALSTERHSMYYQRVGELLGELKLLGAHNMNRRRPSGLTSRRTLQGMLQAYESWRVDGLLPATYDVIFGEVKKV
jgi:malonyl-CoA O-methyltransferase